VRGVEKRDYGWVVFFGGGFILNYRSNDVTTSEGVSFL
jgi:hypothetical protein